MMLGVLKSHGMLKAVEHAYAVHPKKANAVAGFATFAAGDAAAQYYKNDSIDLGQSFKMGVLGLFMNGICLHAWYKGLDILIGSSQVCMKGIGLKMALDQLVYSPMAIMVFFGATAIRDAETKEEKMGLFLQMMNEKYISAYLADCMFWPLVNFTTFRYIPLNYRPSYVAIAQFFWQTILSYISNGDKNLSNIACKDVGTVENTDVIPRSAPVVNPAQKS